MKKTGVFILSFLPFFLFAQQLADLEYTPEIKSPMYEEGKGPVVFIDEGHFNFHTKNGRYASFARLLERDGYQVKAYHGLFNKQGLAKGKILVISNALNEANVNNWFLPNPSAFTKTEIQLLDEWVRAGGSLFLIADHMPMGGAAIDLAAVFGFTFTNGFVFDTVTRSLDFFNLEKLSLVESSLTKGRNEDERVEQVVSFTGQAFKISQDATPILVFGPNYQNMLPDTAWVFNGNTRKYNVEAWSQGAFKRHGTGKIVAFGEAAMFSAQLAGPQKRKMGMNHPSAPENYQLLLNIIHWLDGKLK